MAQMANCDIDLQNVNRLLELIEARYDIRLDYETVEHLQSVRDHYEGKRQFLRQALGEARAYSHPEYAKSFMISEAARFMILKEIDPRPKKRRKKIRGTISQKD